MGASQVLSDPLQRALYDATRPMSRATREVRRCSPVAAVHCGHHARLPRYNAHSRKSSK